MNKKSKNYFIICLVTVSLCLLHYNIFSDKSYEVLLNGNSIGTVQDKESYTKIEKEINECINRRFKNKEGKDQVFFKSNKKIKGLSSKESIIKNFFKHSNIKVETFGVFCKEDYLGALDSHKEYNCVINKVKDRYKEILKLKDINDFKIDNLKLKKCRVQLSGVYIDEKASKEKISREILNNHKSINVQFTSVVEEKKDVNPSTVMKSSSEMIKGERKVQQQEEKGLKNVFSKITVKNEKIVSKNIIGEKIIKNSKDKIILVGSKNPAVLGISCFSKPSRGSISSGFGRRWGRMHNGIDIACSSGNPIYAAYDGNVTFSGWQNGYGKLVIIQHENGMETRYGHCSELLARKGDIVKANSLIARVGSTGRSTGPHLHFEVRKKGIPVNPIEYLK